MIKERLGSIYWAKFYDDSSNGYIGRTTNKDPYNRIEQHISDVQNGSNLEFHQAIRYYGVKNLVVCWLNYKDIPLESLAKMENYYIDKYDTRQNGYNMKGGGEPCKFLFDPTKFDPLKTSIKIKRQCKLPFANDVYLFSELARKLRDSFDQREIIGKIFDFYHLSRNDPENYLEDMIENSVCCGGQTIEINRSQIEKVCFFYFFSWLNHEDINGIGEYEDYRDYISQQDLRIDSLPKTIVDSARFFFSIKRSKFESCYEMFDTMNEIGPFNDYRKNIFIKDINFVDPNWLAKCYFYYSIIFFGRYENAWRTLWKNSMFYTGFSCLKVRSTDLYLPH